MPTHTGADTSASRSSRPGVPPGPWATLATSVVLLVSAFVAAWWLIGDLSIDALAEHDLDYALKAPGYAAGVTPVTGMAALLLAALSGLWMGRSRVVGIPALLIFILAVVWALMARIATAGVIGANLGAGLVILSSPLVALATLAAMAGAVIRARAGRTRTDEPRAEVTG